MRSPVARRVSRGGAIVRAAASRSVDQVEWIGRVVRSPFCLSPGARRLAARTVVNQVRFTATDALPLIGFIAFLVGGTVILQAYAQAVRLGVGDMPVRLLVTIIVRELGPLITALVVLGRSGTAIAAEMASSTVHGETEALEAFGVDPVHAFVLPRVVGLSISAMLLTIYFDTLAFASGIAAARALAAVPLALSLESLRLVLSATDVVVTFAKAAVFGAGIALICSRTGLTVRRSQPTEVPQAVTAAVVMSMLFIFGVSAVVTFAVYA
jgi:phospholipid/cholesterol/gamma-HCH transport system permease protein